jgi:hypothetical protein
LLIVLAYVYWKRRPKKRAKTSSREESLRESETYTSASQLEVGMAGDELQPLPTAKKWGKQKVPGKRGVKGEVVTTGPLGSPRLPPGQNLPMTTGAKGEIMTSGPLGSPLNSPKITDAFSLKLPTQDDASVSARKEFLPLSQRQSPRATVTLGTGLISEAGAPGSSRSQQSSQSQSSFQSLLGGLFSPEKSPQSSTRSIWEQTLAALSPKPTDERAEAPQALAEGSASSSSAVVSDNVKKQIANLFQDDDPKDGSQEQVQVV